MEDLNCKKGIGYAPGAHGNFLILTLNLCFHHSLNGEYLKYEKTAANYDSNKFIYADTIKLPKNIVTPYFDLHDHRLSHFINIKVDNEILWLHQMLCRTHHHNYHINYFERKFLKKAKHHPALKKMYHELPEEIINNWDRDKLKWVYKNKIFGKILKDWPVDSKRHRFTVPFSAFYQFDKFVENVRMLEPTAPIDLLTQLYGEFHQNLIHNDKNLADAGSILYESWQEYIG